VAHGAVAVDRREVRERGRVAGRPDARVGTGHVVQRHVVRELVARDTGLVTGGDGGHDGRHGRVVTGSAVRVQRHEVRVGVRVAA